MTVAPRGYLYNRFRVDTVPARVSGHWTTAGGDIRIYVFTAADFLSWQDERTARPIYCSCSGTEANVDAVLERGEYVVVFDNTFSGGGHKSVSGELNVLEGGDAARAEERATPALLSSAQGATPCPCAGSSPKSPDTAFGWAIGTTVAGWGVALGGAAADSPGLFGLGLAVSALGPSAGHFYAGEIGHGFATSMLRVSGLLLAGAIVAANLESLPWNNHPQGEGMFFIALAATAGFGLYDLIDAPRAARRANERNGFVLGLAPLPPDRNGRPTLGLALSRSF